MYIVTYPVQLALLLRQHLVCPIQLAEVLRHHLNFPKQLAELLSQRQDPGGAAPQTCNR